MKNKKLLSALCLFALVGCQFSTTSSSTNSNKPSSPSTTSSVSNTSSSSSSSSSSESSPEEQLPAVEARIAEYVAKIENSVNAPLSKAVKVQEYSTNTNQNVQTTTFYKGTSYTVQESITSYGHYANGTYKTVKDGRYYELSVSNTIDPSNARYTLDAYKIVEGEANSTYKELTVEEANNKVTSYSPAYVDAFAMGTTLKGLATSIFSEFDSETCYNLTFADTYANANVEGVSYETVSYTKYTVNDWGMENLYSYSCEFKFNNEGLLNGLAFVQTEYDPSTAWDKENNCFVKNATPDSLYYNTYTFEYGEPGEEETPLYNVHDYAYTDFDMEFYKTGSYSYATSSSTFEDPIAVGSDVENMKEFFAKVTTTPEVLESDRIYLSGVNGNGTVNFSYNSTQGMARITLKGEGEMSFTISTSTGTEKTYTFNVYVPDPVSISSYDSIPESLVVGQEIELPQCNVQPSNASQNYEWVFVEGSDYASISHNEETNVYTLKAEKAGNIVVRAQVPNTEIYVDFASTIIEPLSEEELSAKLTAQQWVFKNYEGVSLLTLNKDNTGNITFNDESVFSFNWAFDYSNATLNLTDVTWEYDESNRWSKGAQYNAIDPKISVDLIGRNVTFTFYIDYGYGDLSEYIYEFTPVASFEEIKANFVDSVFQSMVADELYDAYLTVFIVFNNDGTGKLYTTKYDYSTEEEITTVLATFNWSWTENDEIVLDSDLEFIVTVLVWDNATATEYEKDYTFVIKKNMTDLDKLTGSSFAFTYSCGDYTNSDRFSLL